MLAAEPLDPAGYRVSPVGILLDLGPRALWCGVAHWPAVVAAAIGECH